MNSVKWTRLKVMFGFGAYGKTFYMDWSQSIVDFPKVVVYGHRNWEFAFWQESKEKDVEFELTMSEIKIYDPRVNETHHPHIDELIAGSVASSCIHEPVDYSGFTDTYKYCKKCNEVLK